MSYTPFSKFDEWRQEQERASALAKAPASGGQQSPVSSGYGMMGPPGNTASFAPSGPPNRPSGNPGWGGKGFPSNTPSGASDGSQPPSKYLAERPTQPLPWINDVDMASIWWSPFQPVWPYGPPFITRPREWDYQVGYNLQYIQPRMELNEMLRAMRRSWGVLATVETTRQDQLLRIPWTIQVKDKPRATNKRVDEIRRFFRHPDGKSSYGQWARKLMFDLFDIDQPVLYCGNRDRVGRPLTVEVMDGNTFFPLIDDSGRRPDSELRLGDDGTYYVERQPAFQQIVKGLPMLNLDETEVMWAPMRPQPDMPMFGYCFAPDTEVLTAKGWKQISAINWNDTIATRNPETHEFQYQAPIAITSRRFIGDLYNFHSQYLDVLVTPEHNMIVKGRDQTETLIPARDLAKFKWQSYTIPLCSTWHGERIDRVVIGDTWARIQQTKQEVEYAKQLHSSGVTYREIGKWLTKGLTTVYQMINDQYDYNSPQSFPVDTIMSGDDYCAFMGMWLSEGSTNKGRIVVVSQSENSDAFAEFKALLAHLFGTVGREKADFKVHRTSLAQWLSRFGHSHEKYIPEDIMFASEEQIRIFLDYYTMGDGSVKENGQTFIYTASERMAGQLQELAQKIGISATIHEIIPRDSKGQVIKAENCRISYRVSFRRSATYAGFRVDKVPFDGTVHCLSVPNKSVYVRRNGLACWTSQSPVNQIYVETMEAIRKTFYQLEFWRDGSIPNLIITVPDAWTPRQIAMFQGHFDALLSGQTDLKSKVRFVPGGMKPFDIKNSSGESLWSQRDEILIRLACYAFSVSPTPFIKQTNRATAQNAQQTAQEEGLYPLMSYWKDDIIDVIIQEKFGYDDIEHTFLPRPEVDQEKAAKIYDLAIKDGLRSINEIREEQGQEPVEGGDVHLLFVGNAVVPLEQAAAGAAMPMQGGNDNGQDASDGGKPAAKPVASPRSAVQGRPQSGSGRANHASPQPSPIQKASGAQVRSAADDATEDLETLSPREIAVGNYPKGHVWVQGLNISIENNTGSKRGEKTRKGKLKYVNMPAPYGYIRGTIGADKSQVDVYLGPAPQSPTVWVVDQDKVSRSGKPKKFDEHKVFIGYRSLREVVRDYLASHFDGFGHEKLDSVVELSMSEFKRWLAQGDTKEPIAEQPTGGSIVLRRKDLAKSGDTISSVTGLSWYDQTVAAPKRKRRRRAKRSGSRWLELRAG